MRDEEPNLNAANSVGSLNSEQLSDHNFPSRADLINMEDLNKKSIYDRTEKKETEKNGWKRYGAPLLQARSLTGYDPRFRGISSGMPFSRSARVDLAIHHHRPPIYSIKIPFRALIPQEKTLPFQPNLPWSSK